jgi:regulator of protease activity HflC (stomatin/prohibitin superfamily)
MLMVTRYVSTAAGAMGTVLISFGLLVSLLSYFHMGLAEREQFERMELEEMSKSRGSQSLFATAGADTFPAKRSRELFERYFVPVFTGWLFILQAAATYWPWEKLAALPPLVAEHATLAMSLIGLSGLVLFLLGKYSTGLARRIPDQRLLRPSAAYMLLSAYVCFAVTATLAAVLAGFPRADLIVARLLCVVCGFAAIETLLGLILEVYRVRVRGRDSRLLYESRLVGMLGQPEAIITTAAQALDYQFGFNVSETWFYRFLRSALGWLLLSQFAILILSTCFVIIKTGDQALLERFGRPLGQDGVIGPGLHVKLPWPIDQVKVFHTEQIQRFIVGADPETSDTIAWATPHAKEDNFLIASRDLNPELETNQATEAKSPPVNLLSVSIPVQYQITNLATWAYVNQDPDALLHGISLRAVGQYLASADMDSLMSSGRAAAAQALRENIQAEADALNLGVRIVFLGLEDVHPPVKVAKVFEQVVGESELREARVLDAQADAIATNASASARSFQLVHSAQADQHRAIVTSAARAMLFTNQELAYAAAPGQGGVYEQRAYLQTLVDASADARKYVIVTTNTPDILIFNLEDKLRPDLIDQLPSPSSK